MQIESADVPSKLLLAELTREQIRALAAEAVAVLPTASTEQHGPHLPVCTDATLCEAVCLAGAAKAAAEVRVVVAPPLVYGISHHHFPYPGVLSLPSETIIQVAREVCVGLAASGFRRILIVNGHGGNDEAVRIVARDLANSHQVAVAATSYWTLAQSTPAVAEARAAGPVPGHAGHFETSLMLAIRPDLVDGRPEAGTGRSDPAPRPSVTLARSGSRIGDGPGHTDDASRASADLGRRLLDEIATELASLLRDLARL
jgi:creatinine amidohydrolase